MFDVQRFSIALGIFAEWRTLERVVKRVGRPLNSSIFQSPQLNIRFHNAIIYRVSSDNRAPHFRQPTHTIFSISPKTLSGSPYLTFVEHRPA
jgi:hypothetical protein